MALIHRTVFLVALLVCVSADRNPWNVLQDWQNQICSNPSVASWYPNLCTTTTSTTTTMTTTTKESSTAGGSTTAQSTTTTNVEFTVGVTPTTPTMESGETDVTTSSTPLERAHWCKFQNGSTIALGYSFMYSTCAVCQCLPSRSIRCTNLQCMTTYCIDGSQPAAADGQCCPKCAYDNSSSTCTYGTVTVPHGTIVKQSSNGVTCWCQSGTMECRKLPGISTVSEIWGDGMGIYLVVIIIIIVLLLGTCTCVGCSVYFYYYYQKRNQTMTEEHAQYWNHAGWQPMDADGTTEEKKIEAEQVVDSAEYPGGFNPEYIPPPYATYNNGVYPKERSQ